MKRFPVNIQLALFQPDIPQNTGTLIRLGVCLETRVHIIHPTGFLFSDKRLKRAAMDYAEQMELIEHDSFNTFLDWLKSTGKRLLLLSTKATSSIYDFSYHSNDILLMGRESAGVPEYVRQASDAQLRIPMAKNVRSINVSIAAAMVLGEAKRQTDGFRSLQ